MCRSRADACRRAAVVLVAVAALAAGCHTRSRALEADARAYVRLAVALGEHDPDSLDFYAGPDEAVDDVRRNLPSLSEIRSEALSILQHLAPADRTSSGREATLSANLGRIATRVDVLRGLHPPFAQEARALFGIVPPPADRRRLAALRRALDELLPGDQKFTERYTAFAARFVVPHDRLAAVVRAALDECRQRTAAHLSLPTNEQVTFEFVHDRPWSAYSRYRGRGHSVIQLNTDFALTVDQVLQLACHEGYPGHHTRNLLRDSPDDPASAWPERAVQLTFSPDALVAEAAATTAIDVAFDESDRVRVVRDRLAPLAGVRGGDIDKHVAIERLMSALQEGEADIAGAYLDGRLEFERAVEVLEQETLVPHAETVVKYMNEYRTYMIAYTSAAHLFQTRLEACADARWTCFQSAMLQPTLAVDAGR